MKVISTPSDVKLFWVMIVCLMLSCDAKNGESSKTKSDSITETSQIIGDTAHTLIEFSEYTLSRSYIKGLPSNSKVIIFQTEIHDGEFKLIAYYDEPGSSGPVRNYVRIPESELLKGKKASLSFPFSIGNNQIRISHLLKDEYLNLSILPIVDSKVLIFELKGLTSALAPIPLGNTNPSPPDTSFE